MLMSCPKCSEVIPHVEARGPTVGNPLTGPLYSGVVATCPRCGAVLGVMNDPEMIVARLMEEMKKRR
jgi:hypothetical protein